MFNKEDWLQELKEIRIRKGISLNEMALLIDTSASGVSSIEEGNPTLRKLAKYLEVLGFDLNDIFTE